LLASTFLQSEIVTSCIKFCYFDKTLYLWRVKTYQIDNLLYLKE
jgi:hypothetical protein